MDVLYRLSYEGVTRSQSLPRVRKALRSSRDTWCWSCWWWEQDLNLRRHSRLVYSQVPLATRASHRERATVLTPSHGTNPGTIQGSTFAPIVIPRVAVIRSLGMTQRFPPAST